MRAGRSVRPSKAMSELDHSALLAVALAEARKGLAEGGIPVGAAIFDAAGKLVGSGHNRRVQNGDPSLHGETDALRIAGLQRGSGTGSIRARTSDERWGTRS
jgi:cytosine/creatinine deaminase